VCFLFLKLADRCIAFPKCLSPAILPFRFSSNPENPVHLDGHVQTLCLRNFLLYILVERCRKVIIPISKGICSSLCCCPYILISIILFLVGRELEQSSQSGRDWEEKGIQGRSCIRYIRAVRLAPPQFNKPAIRGLFFLIRLCFQHFGSVAICQ